MFQLFFKFGGWFDGIVTRVESDGHCRVKFEGSKAKAVVVTTDELHRLENESKLGEVGFLMFGFSG